MPAWIPVCRCRHRVGCARIKKAISEHGAFQHAGARFRTRGVSERLSGVSGRLAFRNGFWAFRDGWRWRSGTAFGVPGWLLGVLARVSACRNAGRSGMGGGVPGTAARRSGMAKTRSGTRGVPERVLPFRNGFWCSEAAIGGPERGGRRPRTASERAGTASGVPAREASIRSARRTLSPSQHPHSACDLVFTYTYFTISTRMTHACTPPYYTEASTSRRLQTIAQAAPLTRSSVTRRPTARSAAGGPRAPTPPLPHDTRVRVRRRARARRCEGDGPRLRRR
jgi:hypothetical protein